MIISPIWLRVPGGTEPVGDITGSLLAQESGKDILAVSLDVNIFGSITTQELTVDSASLSGLTLVNSDFLVQEAGKDTFYATSDVTYPVITGNLTSQEVGVDSFTSSANSFVKATLTTQEAEKDSLVSSAKVSIVSNLASQESNTDSAIITAKTSLEAVLNASEEGTDSLSANLLAQIAADFSAQESYLKDSIQTSSEVIVSASLATEETGKDSVTIFGTVQPEGAGANLFVREQGSDTLNGFGLLTIQILISAQEGNKDSLNAAAVVSNSLALNAQEQNKDTLEGSFSALISSSLAVQEVNNDIFQGFLYAPVPTDGSLLVRESGSDSLSANVDNLIQGSALAIEQLEDNISSQASLEVRGNLSIQEAPVKDIFIYQQGATFFEVLKLVSEINIALSFESKVNSFLAFDSKVTSKITLSSKLY